MTNALTVTNGLTVTDALTVTDLPAPPSTAAARTVLICDEYAATRLALGHRLSRLSGGPVRILATVADGITLLDAYGRRPADLVLIGLHRGAPLGTQAVDLLLGRHPTATVIAFGSADDGTQLTAALTRGARGLMLWNINGCYRPTEPGRPDKPQPGGSRTVLTERELQILRGMCNGQSNSATGRELLLSEDTIKSHASALFRKLGARDRAHAVALGLRNGLVH